MTSKHLNMFLATLIKHKGSDLHLKSEDYPMARINKKMTKIANNILKREHMTMLAKEILGERFNRFVKEKSIDFNYKYDDNYRFRVNAFFQIDGISMVFRVIPVKIPKLEDLKLPSKLLDITKLNQGLVLVTGSTGNGKSTTLASLIDYINTNFEKHIITVEDPIEFVHKSKKSLINQRSIGEDAVDFASALRAALREDPDVILVGEMRDKETIDIALKAAETGHLVFGTLHTSTAPEAITRIISMFPPDEHTRIRTVLATSLEYVITQRLVPGTKDKIVPVIEFMKVNKRIEEMIIEGQETQINDIIEESKSTYNMNSFDQDLIDKYLNGLITYETALQFTNNQSDFQIKLKKEKIKFYKDKNVEIENDTDEPPIELKE